MTKEEIEEWREWLLADVTLDHRDDANELCNLAQSGLKYDTLKATVEELLETAFFDDDMIGEETQAVLTSLGRLIAPEEPSEPS